MTTLKIISHSEEETEALGGRIAAHLFPGTFIALWGELGTGKTALSRGIGKGLGADGVMSPTFTIVQEHAGRLPLYHFDVYRLHGGNELYDVGFSEYLDAGGVILMEWPEHVRDTLPKARLDIHIQGSGNEERKIELHPTDLRYVALTEAVRQEAGEWTLC